MLRGFLTSSYSRLCITTPYIPVTSSCKFQTTSLAASYMSAFQKPNSFTTQKRWLSTSAHDFPTLASPFCGLSSLRLSKNKQLITTQKLMLSTNASHKKVEQETDDEKRERRKKFIGRTLNKLRCFGMNVASSIKEWLTIVVGGPILFLFYLFTAACACGVLFAIVSCIKYISEKILGKN